MSMVKDFILKADVFPHPLFLTILATLPIAMLSCLRETPEG